MTIHLEDRLADAFDRFAETTVVEPAPPFDGPDRRRHDGARRLAVPAAVLALIAAGTVAVVTTTTHRAGTAEPSSTDAVIAMPPDLFTDPAVPIEWTVIEPESSIRHSNVSSIVAGPGGFVGVGMGFTEMSDGQGRVWFSSDGESWTEAAPDVFRPQGIYQVTATSTAYYLYATRTQPTEGSPAEPAQLYRSSDGLDWEPIGGPTLDAGQVVAAGDVLLRTSMAAGGVLTSTDGLTWTPATFMPSVDPTATYFDNRIVGANGMFYVASWTDADGELWTSPDGFTWTSLPAPQPLGRLVSTPGGLVSYGSSDETACAVGAPDTDPDQLLAAQWNCSVVGGVSLLPVGTTGWLMAGSGPRPSPVLPGIAAFGNQLVASVLRPDAGLSVWLSSDGAMWTGPAADTAASELSLFQRGSPQGFYVSAQNDTTIVIPASASGVGEETQLVVGHVARVDQVA